MWTLNMLKPERKIIELYPDLDQFLGRPSREIQFVVLDCLKAICRNPLRSHATRDCFEDVLFGHNGYPNDHTKRVSARKLIYRAWKALEDDDLIEEPDAENGKHGYRVVSEKGWAVDTEANLATAEVRSQFRRNWFHPSLPDASWNAFSVGDYDTAAFEAFKGVEVAVRKKGGFPDTAFGVQLMDDAFDHAKGRLTDKAATRPQQNARHNIFKGAFGEIRNPRGHTGPNITDPLIAVEEMMTASKLLRIVNSL